ncbi:glycoside hydrolase [Mycena floridula]|nr:glycoside hydrolase [Mycena floridula]
MQLQILDQFSWKQRSDVASVLDELSIGAATSNDPKSGWRNAVTFPSEIHVELLKQGLIPDPYIGFNEHEVQWIGEVEWLYKCSFPFTSNNSIRAELEFLGLDTLCDVYLNGNLILQAENQFQTHVVPLDIADLQPQNELLLHFGSAKKKAKAIEEKRGQVRAGSTNLGDPSRVYLRKAQYDWRWDWGPELMTCGPYRPINLRTYTSRIAEVQTHALVTDLTTSATQLKVDVTIDGELESDSYLSVLFRQANKEGAEIYREDKVVVKSIGKIKDAITCNSENVKLWWPLGYGEQNLYLVAVSLCDAKGNIMDHHETTVGFRTVKLIQEELTEADEYGTGTTFLFEVNGIRMFMGGSNWIPADNFLTTITPERYRAWLTLMKNGHQNMVRLWGGGIYEPDVFYDLCDELGILVWQDFQFACGVYPADDTFVASVRKEAEDNVKRLRSHPSIAIFCGNNEDYQMLVQWNWDASNFPAIKIYEQVLPSVVDALTSPVIPYHRGSPYGGKGWDTSDPTVGDVHQWNVWGGKERPYQEYDILGGRFVSEFGIPSMPVMKTVDHWMQGADDVHRYAQSPLMAQHCRAGLFERRFAIVMNDNFRMTEDLETAVFNTQIMQSEAVGYAYQVWRRKWAGPGKQHTGGVLVWQLNDCWPVTSWALVDYFLRPKPAYYTIARHLGNIAVGIYRTVTKDRPNDRPKQYYEFGSYRSVKAVVDIWGVNSSLSERSATLKVDFVDLYSSCTVSQSHDVVLLPNQATELLSIPCPSPQKDGVLPPPEAWTTSHSVVASARLIDPKTGEVLARFADWPQPYRYLELPDPGLTIEVKSGSGGQSTIAVEVQKPVKCLVLAVRGEGSEVEWSDNALDVMPGDKQILAVSGLEGREITVSYLGKPKADVV